MLWLIYCFSFCVDPLGAKEPTPSLPRFPMSLVRNGLWLALVTTWCMQNGPINGRMQHACGALGVPSETLNANFNPNSSETNMQYSRSAIFQWILFCREPPRYVFFESMCFLPHYLWSNWEHFAFFDRYLCAHGNLGLTNPSSMTFHATKSKPQKVTMSRYVRVMMLKASWTILPSLDTTRHD